jgi:hypothetical protein
MSQLKELKIKRRVAYEYGALNFAADVIEDVAKEITVKPLLY